ncbi:arginase [Alsobacter metallidurans]|uniref:Arginase n=1 Tax=Alsobacter metallidurans TaxID=340221 RepID=A0A917MJP5_9HYPH|nr:arginase [Alsobacter metallidurans]GGH19056.1 arginase [Alsobacter metallidurans]
MRPQLFHRAAPPPTVTILDLDGSALEQAPVLARLHAGSATTLEMRDLGRALRLWAWKPDFEAFKARLPAPADAPEIFLLGSGDYHHLTAALLERRGEPLTVVHFDNHPDWAWTFPRRHCGSWVNAVLAMPHVVRVVTIGCCSGDLANLDKAGCNLRALRSGRLEIHPWYHSPTELSDPAKPIPGHVVEHGRLHWRNMVNEDWDLAIREIFEAIPTKSVWLTIDKDVLAPEHAATNWDQGALPLAFLERAISRLAIERRMAGVDICGDYSPAQHRHPMKWTESLLDQPRRPPASTAINAVVNARLLDLLEHVL